MNLYANHFACSKNNDTGDLIIQFLQVSPNLMIGEKGVEVSGVNTEIVSSIILTSDNAKAFSQTLNDVLNH